MSIYKDLGVKTYINAYDTMTIYGGSRMDPRVAKSFIESSSEYVDIRELQVAIGNKIAQLTKNEGAYVTSGASAGLMLAATACMAGKDMYHIRKLPDTSGLKNEIIIMKAQRNPYDKGIETSGAKFVEIGNLRSTEDYELEGAINEKTAAVYYLIATNYSKATLPLEKVIEIAHKHGVYVIVDAAAQLPPVDNLWKFTEMGADLVAFSGGKALCGPLSTGFLVGKKELIESCRLIGYPNYSIGRVLKIGREEMVALMLAIEKYVSMDQETYQNRFLSMATYLVDRINKLEFFEASIITEGPVGQKYPRAKISIKTDAFTVEEFAQELKNNDPGILVGLPLDKPYDVFYLNPLVLDDNEMEIIVDQINKVSQRLSSQEGN